MTATTRALVLVRNDVTHDARVLREAGVLAEKGWDPLIAGVVTERASRRTEEVGGCKVVRLAPGRRRRRPAAAARPGAGGTGPGPAPERPLGSPPLRARLRRLLVTLDYYRRGVGLILRHRPSLVHANDYNTMWLGVAAKLLCGSGLIYDTHELWADRNGRPEWRPWLLVCEAAFVRLADVAITTSPGYSEELSRRYRVPPPQVVRNIPDASEGETPRAAAVDPRDAPVAAYVGGLLRGRGLEQAIDAAQLLPELRLRLIGPGAEAYIAELRERAASAGVAERVAFEGPVAPGRVVESLAGAAVGLMLIRPVCRSYMLTLPNKLFEYVAAGVPILSSEMPVMAKVVREGGLGEVVQAEDPASTAEGISRLLDRERQQECRRAIAAFASEHTWSRERGRLEQAYAAADARAGSTISA